MGEQMIGLVSVFLIESPDVAEQWRLFGASSMATISSELGLMQESATAAASDEPE